MTRTQQIEQLEQDWQTARWQGIIRPYSAAEVVNLRGSLQPADRKSTRLNSSHA